MVYSTSTAPVPLAEGHLGFNQTRIEAGEVSGELFMTHGHIHVRPDGETYIGQSGQGGILLSKDGEVVWVAMAAGIVGYIPPGWTHRSVNTGLAPFVFISVYPALSWQDYDVVWIRRGSRRPSGRHALRAPCAIRSHHLVKLDRVRRVIDVRLSNDIVLNLARAGQTLPTNPGVVAHIIDRPFWSHGASHQPQIWVEEDIANRVRL